MDSLLIKQRAIGNVSAILTVACDGVGSFEDGDFASGAAVKLLGQWFDKVDTISHIGLRMRDAAMHNNSQILNETTHLGIKTATTLSALLITGTDYYIAHIGDSRIYSYEDGEITTLTSDDVSETGALTACIGRSNDIILQYSEGTAINKTFMVCTDGIYKKTDKDYLQEIMQKWSRRPSQKILDELIKTAVDNGEQDNITLALVKIKT